MGKKGFLRGAQGRKNDVVFPIMASNKLRVEIRLSSRCLQDPMRERGDTGEAGGKGLNTSLDIVDPCSPLLREEWDAGLVTAPKGA